MDHVNRTVHVHSYLYIVRAGLIDALWTSELFCQGSALEGVTGMRGRWEGTTTPPTPLLMGSTLLEGEELKARRV